MDCRRAEQLLVTPFGLADHERLDMCRPTLMSAEQPKFSLCFSQYEAEVERDQPSGIKKHVLGFEAFGLVLLLAAPKL